MYWYNSPFAQKLLKIVSSESSVLLSQQCRQFIARFYLHLLLYLFQTYLKLLEWCLGLHKSSPTFTASKTLLCGGMAFLPVAPLDARAVITLKQGGITCGAIDEPRKSSKAIDERVILNFRDKMS